MQISRSTQSFECYSHTVHMLTQWHLPHPLTSTMKSSLFMYVHSSPLSLAARLHQCCTNCSYYINNDWTSSWTDLIFPSITLEELIYKNSKLQACGRNNLVDERLTHKWKPLTFFTLRRMKPVMHILKSGTRTYPQRGVGPGLQSPQDTRWALYSNRDFGEKSSSESDRFQSWGSTYKR